MDHAIEEDVAGAASAGGFLAWRRKHALPPGSLCRNCNAQLQGPWCHNCGQLGVDFHKSMWHLAVEAIENLFHADGRLLHTVPRLILRPAQLTHDYLAGKRAAQIPPLRLFLVVLLLVFIAGNMASRAGHVRFVHIDSTPGDFAEVKKVQVHINPKWDQALTAWTQDRLTKALAHPDAFAAAMGEWAHDVAFLTLPLSALILSALFAFRRGFMMYDHLIFSIHSLSFQGLLFVTVMASAPLLGAAANILFAASPVHLYAHMRGVYGTGRWGTLIYMTILMFAATIAFGLLMMGLVVLGLEDLRG